MTDITLDEIAEAMAAYPPISLRWHNQKSMTDGLARMVAAHRATKAAKPAPKGKVWIWADADGRVRASTLPCGNVIATLDLDARTCTLADGALLREDVGRMHVAMDNQTAEIDRLRNNLASAYDRMSRIAKKCNEAWGERDRLRHKLDCIKGFMGTIKEA